MNTQSIFIYGKKGIKYRKFYNTPPSPILALDLARG